MLAATLLPAALITAALPLLAEAVNRRLDRIEQMMERLERRLWLTVYGVAAVILAQAFQSFMAVQ